MEAYEMIDRYVNEVGERLPRKTRADIEMELRSLIQDALEEQSGENGIEPTAKITAEFLREFGSPDEIAARYRPEESLIGPDLFPTYRAVITIVVSVIAGLHFIVLLFLLVQNRIDSFAQTISGLFGSFWEIALTSAGITTIIFAIIERVGKEEIEREATTPQVWDPYQLPPVKDPDRINRGELISGIVFSVIAIIIFNFFFDLIGAIDLAGPDRGVIPLLAPEFKSQIPWLTAVWALDSLLKLAVLVQGRWQAATRWLEIGVETFSIFVLYRIFTSGVITIISPLDFLVRGVIGIIILIVIFEIIGKLYRAIFKRPFRATPPALTNTI